MSRADPLAVHHEISCLAREHLLWESELSLDARLAEDLELDSLQRMTLAIEVENHFEICLEPEDEAEIETVRDLVETVVRKHDTDATDAPTRGAP